MRNERFFGMYKGRRVEVLDLNAPWNGGPVKAYITWPGHGMRKTVLASEVTPLPDETVTTKEAV